MDKKKCLVVGAGFVGGTCYRALSRIKHYWEVAVCDKDPESSLLWNSPDFDHLKKINWQDIKFVKDVDLVFVCTPTPMIKQTGECYTGIVESVIKEVRTYNQNCWICIKSTVPPGTTQELHEKYKNVCFNPEFLTEKYAFEDFVELPYQIIGYPELMPGLFDSLDNPVEQLYNEAFKQSLIASEHILSMTSTQAEMVKYTRNAYLATRLSFFNEIKQICDKLGIPYDQMKYFAGLDVRVGRHYNNVEESNPGWGLSCLPKDLNAIKFLAKNLGVNTLVLDAVWQKNLEVRKDKDWENMEKAVIIKEE